MTYRRKIRNYTEYLLVKVNLSKQKLLLCCSSNLNKQIISNHFHLLRKVLDFCSSKLRTGRLGFERFLPTGLFDFHKLTETDPKTFFKKQWPNVL